MKQQLNLKIAPVLSGLGLVVLASSAQAQQPFVYSNSDLCLTFRKVTPYTENSEVVINIGQASTYVNAAVGTHMPVPGLSSAQLVPGSFSSFDNLSWSIFGWYSGGNAGYPGYPTYTLWLTVPRRDNAVRSPDAVRHYAAEQANTQVPMLSILGNATFISKAIATSNTYNNATFVRESLATYPQHNLSIWMGGLVDNNMGTLNDTWIDNNIEQFTPDFFTGSGNTVRSDLYEVRPLDNGHGGAISDPHTGTSGLAYYVGYFELSSDGSLSFVREAGSTTVPNPPPPPQLEIIRTENLNTISFVSSNSATYTLFFTNEAGLTSPVSNWPSLPGTITGNGTTQSFQDTTTDPSRFYRIQGR